MPLGGPAQAGVFNLIPANQFEEPTDSFRADDALFFYATSDHQGGRVCVVPTEGELADLSCDRPAWGSPNVVAGVGTVFMLAEAPFLRPGTWRLFSESVNGQTKFALSPPFHVAPCADDCDATLAQEIVDEFKENAKAIYQHHYYACLAWVVASEIKDAKGDFKKVIQGKELLDALELRNKLEKSADKLETFWEQGPSSAVVSIGPPGFAVVFSGADQVVRTGEKKAKEILRNLVCTLGAAYLDIKNDPPDPDFDTVHEPTTRLIAPLSDPESDDFAEQADRELGLAMAILHAFERFQGAEMADDRAGMRLQAGAMAEFTYDIVEQIRSKSLALRVYADVLDASGQFDDPLFEDQDRHDHVQAVHQRITVQGFTQEELDNLESLGLSAEEIENVRDEFDVDLTAIPPGVTGQQILRQVASDLVSDLSGFDQFARNAEAVATSLEGSEDPDPNLPPTASFTSTPSSGPAPLTVEFQATSTDPDDDPLTHTWDFGDGATATGDAVSNTYHDSGTYTVTLTADDGQATDSADQTIIVTDPDTNSPPTASFTANPTSGQAPLTVNFQATSIDPDDDVLTHTWDFGDGGAGVGASVTHTYFSAGEYEAMLTSCDATACDTTTRLIAVSRRPAFPSLAGGAPDSLGRGFWLAFMENHELAELSLFITGPTTTAGSVQIPGLGFSEDFLVTPGTVTTVNLPSHAAVSGPDVVEDKGILVAAEDEVTVYGLNRLEHSTDAFLGLPMDVLGTDYLIPSYANSVVLGTQFAVVATEHDTTVTITPAWLTQGRDEGVPYEVQLDQGEVYQLRNQTHPGADLTGTIISSDKAVGVYGGSRCTNIPPWFSYCDHIVDMVAPTDAWGTRFGTMPLATRMNGDTIRIVAAKDDTTVSVNGDQVATLDQTEFHEFVIDQPAVIDASEPVMVAQYSNSTEFDGVTSDPFMMLVPPFEQFLARYTVTTPSDGFRFNFVNIVAPDAAVGSVTLNSTPIPADEFTPIGSSGFSGTQQPIDLGNQVLGGPLPFGVFVYGFDDDDSYGYAGGLSLAPIARVANLVLSPKTATRTPGHEHCVEARVTDQDADPLEGIRVDFKVSGMHSGVGFSFTSTEGIAGFCYTGDNLGEDLIIASTGTSTDTASVTWRVSDPDPAPDPDPDPAPDPDPDPAPDPTQSLASTPSPAPAPSSGVPGSIGSGSFENPTIRPVAVLPQTVRPSAEAVVVGARLPDTGAALAELLRFALQLLALGGGLLVFDRFYKRRRRTD